MTLGCFCLKKNKKFFLACSVYSQQTKFQNKPNLVAKRVPPTHQILVSIDISHKKLWGLFGDWPFLDIGRKCMRWEDTWSLPLVSACASMGMSTPAMDTHPILIGVMVNSGYHLDWICSQLNSLWKDFMEASLEGADSPTEWVTLPLGSPDRISKGGKSAAFPLAVNPCRWAHLLCCCCYHASLTPEISFLQLSYVDWKPVAFREAMRLLSTVLGLLRRPDTCTKQNGYWDFSVSDVQIAVLFMPI